MKTLLTLIIVAAIIYLNYILWMQLLHPAPGTENQIIPGLIKIKAGQGI